MKEYYNFYETAKKAAICKIHKHLKKHLRYNEKFDNTRDTKYKYIAMYHKDIAYHIARDWKLTIDRYNMSEISVRDLGF